MEPAPPPSRLEGTRVLVTRAQAYMGPAITERFGLAGPGSDFFHGQVIPFAGGSALNV